MNTTIKQINELAARVSAIVEGRKSAEAIRTQWERNVEWLGLKVGGQAWLREVLSQAKSGFLATNGGKHQVTKYEISEQTLAEGGFLSGTFVTNQYGVAANEAELAEILA